MDHSKIVSLPYIHEPSRWERLMAKIDDKFFSKKWDELTEGRAELMRQRKASELREVSARNKMRIEEATRSERIMHMLVQREQERMIERMQEEKQKAEELDKGDNWYMDAAGNSYLRPPGEKVEFTGVEWNEAKFTGALTLTNNIKPTVHKAGHFPIQWMNEAFARAEVSEKIITIKLERSGVVVIGEEADNYETHTLPWSMMDHAEVNPILLGIETVEKHLDTLDRLKRRVSKTA